MCTLASFLIGLLIVLTYGSPSASGQSFALGDLDQDGQSGFDPPIDVDDDVRAFSIALIDPGRYFREYPLTTATDIGDFTNDGDVDFDDLSIFLDSYNLNSRPAAFPVPEPTVLHLAIIGAAVACRRNKRKNPELF